MTIDATLDPAGIPTVVLAGRQDILTAAVLRTALSGLFDDGARTIVVDLSAVEFMDSSVLAALVQARTASHAVDGDVILVAPIAADARRILSLTHFDQIFTMRHQHNEQ